MSVVSAVLMVVDRVRSVRVYRANRRKDALRATRLVLWGAAALWLAACGAARQARPARDAATAIAPASSPHGPFTATLAIVRDGVGPCIRVVVSLTNVSSSPQHLYLDEDGFRGGPDVSFVLRGKDGVERVSGSSAGGHAIAWSRERGGYRSVARGESVNVYDQLLHPGARSAPGGLIVLPGRYRIRARVSQTRRQDPVELWNGTVESASADLIIPEALPPTIHAGDTLCPPAAQFGFGSFSLPPGWRWTRHQGPDSVFGELIDEAGTERMRFDVGSGAGDYCRPGEDEDGKPIRTTTVSTESIGGATMRRCIGKRGETVFAFSSGASFWTVGIPDPQALERLTAIMRSLHR